jgi:hypothetical protein
VVPVYNDDDWDEAEAEDEAGNIRVRKVVGVRVVETLEEDEVPSHKQGQTLKHAAPNLDDFDIGEYLTEEELHLIASEGIDVMNDLPPGA